MKLCTIFIANDKKKNMHVMFTLLIMYMCKHVVPTRMCI